MLALAVTIFIAFFLNDFLVNKLKKELTQAFDHYYTISYKSMKTTIDLNGLTIVIDKLSFKSDTSRHDLKEKFPALFFDAHRLILNNLSVRKLLFTTELQFGEITLKNPILKYIVFSKDSAQIQQQNLFKKRKRNNLDFLTINKVKIEHGILASCHNDNKLDTTFLGFNISASIENIHLSVTKIKSLAYSLQSKNNFKFSVAKAFYKPHRASYIFYMDSLFLNDSRKIISAKNLSESTLKSKLEISNQFKFSKLIAETKVGSFLVRGYNLKKLLLNNSIVIQSLKLDNVELELLKNKRRQINKDSEKLLIQQLFTNFSYLIDIDSIIVCNSNLWFELMDHNNKKPVIFHLKQLNALLVNINTTSESKDTMILTGNGKFMDVSNFNIKAVFPNIHEPSNFYSGYVGPMSFKKFNPILKSYSGIKIANGKINSIVFSGSCNKYENNGLLVFNYQDLEIEVEKINKAGNKRKARLISMLGNMVLHNNNPRNKNEAAIWVNYYFKRKTYESPVLQWIGGILEGVKNTLINKNVQKKGKRFFSKKK